MKIKPARRPFRLSLGDRGEIIAAAYLAKKKHKILDQKVRAPFGELDLVTRDRDALVFVEVKTRSGEKYGLPEEAVDLVKQKQMIKLAEWYIQKHEIKNIKMQFDVIAILYNGTKPPQVRHYPNAFQIS